MRNRAVRGRRPAFTLTEMLVVIAIILILTTTGILIAPGLAKQQRAANGADQVQGALLIAKQRAKRDQVPTGVRLIAADPTNPNSDFNELVYVQQPEPYTGGVLSSLNGLQVRFSGVNFLGGTANAFDQPVQAGDYMEVNGGGLLFRIATVSNAALTLESNQQGLSLLNNGTNSQSTSNYRIIRQPRQLAGEDSVRLPRDIVIALKDPNNPNNFLSQNVPQRSIGGVTYYEIVFSPAGGVVGRGTVSSDKVLLYVRDSTKAATDGGPSLIAVQIRTGLIGAYPVNVSGTDPYSFTRDPRGSGL
jgi:prepilin-type N-terminal cleavage/methylation domain-containing protein